MAIFFLPLAFLDLSPPAKSFNRSMMPVISSFFFFL